MVAIGQTEGDSYFRLRLQNGRLNLHSNLISKEDGLKLGENLNNTNWQKVYVAVNSSHLTLGVNDQLQATHPINPTGTYIKIKNKKKQDFMNSSQIKICFEVMKLLQKHLMKLSFF